ncbi:MAG: RIP metalloprotease RseP [Candidatus Omnitrophota bacterium]|jgi:regulator of sigma E protease
MSILIFIIVLSVLIFVHELGHFIVAKRMGVRIEQFALGFGPRVFAWKKNNTEYSICAIPLGGFVKLAGDNPEEFKGNSDEYLAKSAGQRAGIVFAGPLLNYVLAFLCFWLIFFLGAPNLACQVGELLDDFGAKQAGVEVGDKILAIDGKEVKVWQDLQQLVMKRVEGDIVKLSILRNEQRLEIPVRIKQEKMDTIWGEKKTIGLIGIRPADEFVYIKYGLGGAIFAGGSKLFYLTGLTLKSLLWMVWGKLSFRDSVTGPLGIFYITREAAHLGIVPLVQVIAIISMSLSIFNLLPLPVLDGGHLLFILVEKIRGRRLSIRTERVITQIGMSLIILLVIFVFYNDLLRYGVFSKISQWWLK